MFYRDVFRIKIFLNVLTVIGVILFCHDSAFASDNNVPGTDRMQRVAELAHQAILMDILVKVNPESKYLCTTDKYACVSPDASELGLAIIGGQSSDVFKKQMVNIIKYRIDAGLFEDYTCYMLQSGKKILPMLKGINAVEMNRACKKEVSSVIEKMSPLFDELAIDKVCATTEEIDRHVAELKEAIGRNATCGPDDF